MNRLNRDLLKLAKNISKKLDNNVSDVESILDFDDVISSKPNINKNTCTSIGTGQDRIYQYSTPINNDKENKLHLKSDNHRMSPVNYEEGTSKLKSDVSNGKQTLPIQTGVEDYIVGSEMEAVKIEDSNILSADSITDDDELWFIIAPKEYNFKKQHVDMSGRQDLKGGKFEIQFFKEAARRNNMITLLSDKDELVCGPSFEGVCQISEKLQTFNPVYHSSVPTENSIPAGLKERYIPFGADIGTDGLKRQKTEKSKKKSKRKHSESENDTQEMMQEKDVEISFMQLSKKKKKKKN